MLVSRKDVITDRILPNGSFLHLPIASYLHELGIEALDPQIAVINAINNPKYRFVVGALSRRVGKTYISNIIGQVKALEPGSQILIMSPNYRLSQISFDLQRQLLRHFDLEIKRDNAKDGVIELVNGSTIRMGSVNQADSVVGRSYDLIIFDEAALSDEGRTAFDIQLRPTLDKPNSKAIFISTPRGRENWFAEFYQRGFDDKFPEWCSIHATYRDNPRVDTNDVEEARNSMSDAHFKQEYEADFTTYEGKVFEFNFEECVGNFSEMEPSYEVLAGLDHGYRDPTAFIVLIYDGRRYIAVAEYFSSEESTSAIADAIKYYDNKYRIDNIFCDPAAAQFRADLALDHDLQTMPAKKSILDGINHVNGILERNELYIDQGCTNLLKAIEAYRWDTTTKEKPKHDWASHMADALRYALYSHVTGVGTF